MGKQVILGKCLENGQKVVFGTLEEASKEIGVSVSTVSRAAGGFEECHGWSVRWADRVFAVRLKEKYAWEVAVENGRGSGYVKLGDPFVKFRKGDVDQVKDLTVAWYL